MDKKYVVLQTVLKEALFSTKSSTETLSELEDIINKQAGKGYKLHSFSTVASGSKGVMGGDRIQVTMVFEKE